MPFWVKPLLSEWTFVAVRAQSGRGAWGKHSQLGRGGGGWLVVLVVVWVVCCRFILHSSRHARLRTSVAERPLQLE